MSFARLGVFPDIFLEADLTIPIFLVLCMLRRGTN
jgi:hypothetical protein